MPAYTDFAVAFESALSRVQGSGTRLLDAGLQFRASTAGGFEAAVATAAAAAAHVQMEPLLALAPRLPGATAASVCDAFESAAVAARASLPFAITATVLASDPRVAPLVIALLADENQLRDALSEAADSLADVGAIAMALNAGGLPADIAEPVQALAGQMSALLRQGGADAVLQGELVHTAVAELRAGVGVAAAFAGVVGGAVERLYLAAESGVDQVYSTALMQLTALRAAKPARVFAGRTRSRISLDREYSGIVPGSLALLDKGSYVELYRVSAVTHSARAEFALSGKSSYLTLSGQNLSLFSDAVRETAVFARNEVLAQARAPDATPLLGKQLQVAADVVGLQAGRRLIVQGPRAAGGEQLVHHCTLVSATPAADPADGGTLLITPPLPEPLQREGTVVFGNVAPASHGESVTQVLGNGDATQAFQRFELKHAPLTHRAAATESGAEAAITLRVGGVAWQAQRTLYGALADDRAYTLDTDAQGRVWVHFGDGQRGRRADSGQNNLQATMRKGLGQAGNVRAETLTQPASRPLGLKSVANPLPALGGTDPEAPETARRSMPLQTRTLGRAVSVLDYEDFARAYAGIAKAQAAVLQLPAGPTVCVTVAGAEGVVLAPGNPVWNNLLAALRASGDPFVPLRLLSHSASSFQIGLKVKVDAAHDQTVVLAAVERTLRETYAFDKRALGQPVQQSEVIAVAHGVTGVLAVDLDYLYGGSAPASQLFKSRQVRLLASRMQVKAGLAMAAEVLTLDPGPLARLELMS